MGSATYLIAGKFRSRHFGTKPYLAEALQSTGKSKPSVLYVGAPSDDDRTFGAALCALLKQQGAHRVHWPKLSRGKDQEQARSLLREVDLVFVGGGDVEVGMKVLQEQGLVADLHDAHARGAVFAAISAGAILLGERWIRWPEGQEGDDVAETFPCLGVVKVSLDTHGESDGWPETQSFVAVRARETGARARAYAIKSGGALVVNGGGVPLARGLPVGVFAASPGRKATALADVAVQP